MTGDGTDRLLEAGLIAVLRATEATHIPAVADCLVSSGITALEVTFTIPDAVSVFNRLSREFDPSVIIGAGTVVNPDQAKAAVRAGAQFLVSPAASPEVMQVARDAGVAAVPGTFTPTEVLAACQAGAHAVKLFPANALGPGFIRSLRGPFPGVAIIPTGGIAIADIAAWVDAGAAAVGLGGALLGTSVQDGDVAALGERARRAVAALADARARA